MSGKLLCSWLDDNDSTNDDNYVLKVANCMPKNKIK